MKGAKVKLSAFYAKWQFRFRHWEHFGFVAYAGVEVFHLEGMLYGVAVWLLGSGIAVMVGEVIVEEGGVA